MELLTRDNLVKAVSKQIAEEFDRIEHMKKGERNREKTFFTAISYSHIAALVMIVEPFGIMMEELNVKRGEKLPFEILTLLEEEEEEK